MRNIHPLLIGELEVSRLPGMPGGIDRGAFTDLAPHVNVVTGPNASGKSSAARLIGNMLWAKENAGAKARMTIHIDQDSWVIHQDDRHRQVEHLQGMQELPPLPPAEMADMYVLAMHNLISASDRHIARDIMRQMAGGYDLEWSARELDYSGAVKRSTIAEYKRLRKAENEVKEINRRQETLKRSENKLVELEKELRNALDSLSLQEMYEKLVKYLEVRMDLELKQRRVAGFSDKMEKFTGSEIQQVDDLEQDIAEAVERKGLALQEKKQHEEELKSVNLPGEGVQKEVLYELEKRQQLVASHEQKLEKAREDIAAASEAIEMSVKKIDPDLSEVDWDGISLTDIDDLHKYLRESHQLESEKQFLEAETRYLETELSDFPDGDAALLQEGIRTLSKWLHETQSSYGMASRWYYLLAGLGLASALAAIPFGWYALAGIGMMTVVFVLGVKDAKQPDLQIRKADYEQTGLQAPESWTIKDVTIRVDDLVRQLETVRQKQHLAQRLQQRKDDLKALLPRVREMEEKRDQLRAQVGVVPDIPSEHLKNQSALVYFLEAVARWQEKMTALAELKARRQVLESQVRDEIGAINHQLESFRDQGVVDSRTAAAVIRELAEQEDVRQKATRGIQGASEKISLEDEKIMASLGRRAKIYAGLDLEDGDSQQLRLLGQQLEAFREAKKELDRAEDREQIMLAELQKYSFFRENEHQLLSLPVEEAHKEAVKHAEKGAGAEDLRKQISEIKGQVKITMQGSDLEDALLAREESLDPLEEIYHQNLSSVTGDIVAQHIARESEQKDRPAVVKEADRLFSLITQGRYALKLDSRDHHAFMAFDNVQQVNQELDQLSTGTRIQLLLAVRLAYLESQEQAVKPPILADELFANSDDVRAEAIMDALTAISKAGRQVFYFTAQGDELAKWETYLRAHPEISGKRIILKGKTGEVIGKIPAKEGVPAFDLINDWVPEPGGMSHDAYGRDIDVSPFQLLRDQPGQLHIWYLIPDPELIYHCLKKNIRYWGQLDQFIRFHGLLPGLEEWDLQRMREKIKLLSRFQEMYRQGRSKPADRAVLAASGAVSDTFIDDVAQKLEELGGDAEALLQALRDKQVPGFRENKIMQLQDYLLEKGYIDTDEPMEEAEIRLGLQAFLSNIDLDQQDADSFLKLLLGA